MVLKGNLLYNGDFETGTTEGWNSNPYNLSHEHTFFASCPAAFKGNYGGTLFASEDDANLYLSYDKVINFEEYEAYIFSSRVKIVDNGRGGMVLYGLDNKYNLEGVFWLCYNDIVGKWNLFTALVRGIAGVPFYKVGLWFYAPFSGNGFYIDEVNLIPVKSIKGISLMEKWTLSHVTSTQMRYTMLGGVGRFKLVSILETRNVTGTSPTLDTRIIVAQMDDIGRTREIQHSQFTGEKTERIVAEVENVGYIHYRYEVGGTDPSFDIYQHIYLFPE